MRTETITLYTFDELSDSAKERALETVSRWQSEFFDGEAVIEDFERVCAILGVELKQREYKTFKGVTKHERCHWSGFGSQGDGASFEGTYTYPKDFALPGDDGTHYANPVDAIHAYAPEDTELHRIAEVLELHQKQFNYNLSAEIVKSVHYYEHSGTMSVKLSLDPDDGLNDPLPWQEVQKAMRDLADWLYRQLESEYEYQTSREQCIDWIEANEREFDEKGNIQ